jgi:DNA-binding NtrC family response regulator
VLDSRGADVVLLDLKLPGSRGLDALHSVRKQRPEALVIVITGFGTIQSAVQAMRDGAYDYVTKPFSLEELRLLLERVAGHLRLKTENRVLRETIKSRQGFGNIIGRAPEMEKLYRIIAKAAQSTHPVLILGESGTGKELVAKSAFHGTISYQAVHPCRLRIPGPHPNRKRVIRPRARRFHGCDASEGWPAGDR